MTAAAFRFFLDEAHAALLSGEAQDSERRSKAISALVRAERDVAEYLSEVRAATEENDHDALRAELQRRLSLLADADRAGGSAELLAQIAATGAAS